MATASVTYVFANGTNADGTQVNANFTSVLNFLNTEVVQRDASIAFTSIPTLPATTPTLDNHAVRKAYVDAFIPAGIITQYGGAVAPSGWFICDGSAVSRTNPTYSRLFAAIGTTYGAGDGSTTFNVPNLKGRVPVGFDSTQTEFDALAETGGAKTHTLVQSEMPAHTHTQDAHNHTQNAHTHVQDAHTHTQDAHNHSQNSHNHAQDAHGHSANAHNHFVYIETGSNGSHSHSAFLSASNSGRSSGSTLTANLGGTDNTSSAGTHSHLVAGYTGDTTPTVNANTATNQATTATNNAATATNQSNTAVNQNAIAVNLAATATNQSTGGGGAHNNLQPYIVVNHIIKL